MLIGFNSEFFIQNIIDGLALGSLYALFALGIALIFGIMRLINFAHGELIMIAGYAAVWAISWAWPLLVLVVLGVTLVSALGMERLSFRPIRDANPTTLLVTSFALSYLLQNLGVLFFGALPRSLNLFPSLNQYFDIGGVAVQQRDVLVLCTTIVVVGLLALFLTRTPVGVQMRAAAENFQMARLLGVRADRVIAVAFAISGLLAAIASLLFVSETGTVSPAMGLFPVLVAFIATVIGGMGSLVGAALGGMSLGVVSVALQAYLPLELRSYRDAFAFGIVIVVLVVRPQGLIVSRSVATRV
jgi:branched-chain amino acid transport system permease protein